MLPAGQQQKPRQTRGRELTFGFLFPKQRLGDFCKQTLCRVGGTQLWHHHTAAGGELIRCVTLGRERACHCLVHLPPRTTHHTARQTTAALGLLAVATFSPLTARGGSHFLGAALKGLHLRIGLPETQPPLTCNSHMAPECRCSSNVYKGI